MVDFVATYAATDALSLSIDAGYAYSAGAVDGHAAQWYGIAGYASYKLNDVFSLNGRLEWFRDNDGFIVTNAVGMPTGIASNYYEATLGLGIRPFPNDKWGQNLVIRPEVRYDYADNATFGDDNHSTVTVAVDAYFTF